MKKSTWKRSFPLLLRLLLPLYLLVLAHGVTHAADRFPQPEFETAYSHPKAIWPDVRAHWLEYLDVVVLAGTLSLAAYLVLKLRSRGAVFWLMIFCLIYFGFWRQGCVCAVGSIQNVVAALTDPSFTIPIPVLLFFLLPMLFALLFGRVFCAAVCPLGGIQDVVVMNPVKVPTQLDQALRLLPSVYLGAAVLCAATGAGFIICRYDPFIALFRLSGSFAMLVTGAFFLVLGIFIARPYCRWLCPYGVLLSWLSWLSWHHARITPDECIQCRLCEDSCPFNAIERPTSENSDLNSEQGVRNLIVVLALVPLIIGLFAWAGSLSHAWLARLNMNTSMAEQILKEKSNATVATTLESRSFRDTGKPPAQLYRDAATLQQRLRRGGWWFGAFVGLVLSAKLVRLSIRRSRTDFEAVKMLCLSCARCFDYCPVGKPVKGRAAASAKRKKGVS